MNKYTLSYFATSHGHLDDAMGSTFTTEKQFMYKCGAYCPVSLYYFPFLWLKMIVICLRNRYFALFIQ